MSYAALLALSAALAFALPFLVRLAERVGIPRGSGILATLAVVIFLGVYAWLHWRLRDQDAPAPDADFEPGVLPSEPYVPGFFYKEGVFRGETLLAEGKAEEALEVYRAYRAILERQGQPQAGVSATILRLERAASPQEETRARIQGPRPEQ